MQALWNMLASRTVQPPPPLLEVLSVACDEWIEMERRTLAAPSNDIIAVRTEIARTHLGIPREDCLARTKEGAPRIVAWYSKDAQLTQQPSMLNKRASNMMGESFYGDIVFTGFLAGDMYLSCPADVENTATPAAPPPYVGLETMPHMFVDTIEPPPGDAEPILVLPPPEEYVPFSSHKKKKKKRVPLTQRKSKRKRKQAY